MLIHLVFVGHLVGSFLSSFPQPCVFYLLSVPFLPEHGFWHDDIFCDSDQHLPFYGGKYVELLIVQYISYSEVLC